MAATTTIHRATQVNRHGLDAVIGRVNDELRGEGFGLWWRGEKVAGTWTITVTCDGTNLSAVAPVVGRERGVEMFAIGEAIHAVLPANLIA